MSRWGRAGRWRNTRRKASRPISSPRREASAAGSATVASGPGADVVGKTREAELRAAAKELGVREVDAARLSGWRRSTRWIRRPRRRPSRAICAASGRTSSITFGPEGAYGHPDHIAISQLTTAAVVRAADRELAVSKLYHIAWSAPTWAAYQAALKKLTSTVDGVERQVIPSPDWGITTRIDTSARVAGGVARGAVPPDADERLQEPRGAAAGAPSRAVGRAGVLSRIQPRERRPRARIGSVRRTAMMPDAYDVDDAQRPHGARST